MRLLLTATAAVISLAMPAWGQPASGPSFDRFLQGLTRCEKTPAYERFWRAAGDRFGNQSGAKKAVVKANVRVPAPPEIESAIHISRATSRIEGDGEHTIVEIPVTGTWLGVPLKSLEFAFGNENGVSVLSVRFDASRATVQRAFGEAIRRGQALLKRQTASGLDTDRSVGIADGPVLFCDQST